MQLFKNRNAVTVVMCVTVDKSRENSSQALFYKHYCQFSISTIPEK